MLYRLIVGNFSSFAEQVQFDMFPNLKRENFTHHVYNDEEKIPVLKTCALYGANGSGKSNFISALKFIKSFATEFSLGSDPESIISFFKSNRFKLPVQEGSPMSFLIEFGNEAATYIYTFEINETGIIDETLYLSGLGKAESIPLLSRQLSTITFSNKIATKEIIDIIERQLKANPSLSALSIIGKLRLIDNHYINDAFVWLDTQLEIIEVSHQIPWLIEQLNHQPDVMAFVKNVFSNIGLGIKDLSIRNESFEEWLTYADAEDKRAITKFLESSPKIAENRSFAKMNRQFPLFTITEEDGMRTVKELLFYQFGKNGYVGAMECEAQSSGTLRLLTSVPAIYYAIFNKKTVVIDEIDNSIHPVLIKELIKYFGESDSNGQLIFTTHETALLNQQELLRPDEVWMIEKVSGVSRMYSLNDFKIHKTLSLENGYLDGRFGAIPFLGTIDILENENK